MQFITLTPVETAIPSSQATTVLAKLDPWMITLMVILALAALILSLLMIYSYINNIRTTDIHRKMIYDSVFAARYQILKGQTAQIKYAESADDDPDQLEQQKREALSWQQSYKNRVAELQKKEKLSEEELQEIKHAEEEIRKYETDMGGYYSDEHIKKLREQKQLREKEILEQENRIRNLASREAETLVPRSLTVAGMGITGSFFIELTAIITIIFGIIILGLVGVLGTAEIAPILAAIAGYVLGKTSNSGAYPGGTILSPQIPTHETPLSLSPQTEDEEKSLPASASKRKNK